MSSTTTLSFESKYLSLWIQLELYGLLYIRPATKKNVYSHYECSTNLSNTTFI